MEKFELVERLADSSAYGFDASQPISTLYQATTNAREDADATLARRVLSSRQLELIRVIARSRSLRAAGLAAGISQSGLTRQLQLMESRLGVKIAERDSNGVRLTEAGERVLSLAQITRQLELQMLHELSAQRSSLRGQVRVCGFSSVMRSVVVPSLADLLRRHSALTLISIVEELYLVASRSATGEADIFITQVPVRLAGYSSQVIGQEINLLIESDRHATPPVLIDHEPEDRFSEHYLSLAGLEIPTPFRRLFLNDIYGLLDGVRAGLGRAVVPLHLLDRGTGIRAVAGAPPLLVPVVLNVRSAMLEVSTIRAAVDALVANAKRFLDRDELGIDLARSIRGGFMGPSHLFAA